MTDAERPIWADEVEAWRAHVGRSEARSQVLEAETLRRFAAAVGAPLEVETDWPPLGHWAFFLDAAPASALGPDGHPRRGGLLPPVRLARRMFAASEMRFEAPLTLGEAAQLTLTVADVRHRPGRTGDLVFVELDRVLTQAGRTCVSERQTIVYRGAGEPTAPVVPGGLEPRAGTQLWTPDAVELFRFSAVTFNAHRIHYDLPYAQGGEGYPALVVHGPLTAAKLAALAVAGSHAPLRRFSFRATAPLFADQPVRLEPGGTAGAVQAVRCDGATAMTAEAGFA